MYRVRQWIGRFCNTLFLVRQHWGGCRYRHFAAKFKVFYLQWSSGLEHNVLVQKLVELQSTAPLQRNRFKVGNKMAIAASTPLLPNYKKQCCKIDRFTNALCTCNSADHFHFWISNSTCYICIKSCLPTKVSVAARSKFATL